MAAKKEAPSKTAPKAPKAPVTRVAEAAINLEVDKKATIKLGGMKIVLTAGQTGVQIRSAGKLCLTFENDRCFEVSEV